MASEVTPPAPPRSARHVAAFLLLTVVTAPVLVTGAVDARAHATSRTPTTTPAGNAFYEPPNPLPNGKPGELIRSAPLDAPRGARAWKVLYHSRAVDGHDIAVSGVVVAPRGKAPSRGQPVIALGHPLAGLADRCSPSKARGELSFPGSRELLDAGYVLTATDYEGLGTPGLHPFTVGESEGRGVLDAARVARHVRRAHASNRVVPWGYSQGGHAALFAAELAPTYAPELDVLGAAATAPITSVADVTALASTYSPVLGFAVMVVKGIEAAYPEADAGLLLTPQALVDSNVVNQRCADSVLALFAGRQPADVFTRNPADDPVWRELLERNSLGPGRIKIPTLLVKGDADETLPKPLTDQFVNHACDAGDPIDYRVYPRATHTSVLHISAADVVTWITERINDTPAVSTC